MGSNDQLITSTAYNKRLTKNEPGNKMLHLLIYTIKTMLHPYFRSISVTFQVFRDLSCFQPSM